MRAFILIITGFFFCLNLFGQQNTGYLGKRVVVKSDMFQSINLFFPGIDVEYIPTRSTSITLGIRYSFSYMRQVYKTYDYSTGGLTQELDLDDFTKMPKLALIKTRALHAELRQYIGPRLFLPAPEGLFLYTSFQFGLIDIKKGMYHKNLVTYNNPSNDYVNYSYQNINFFSWDVLGVGYQTFVNKRFTIGVKSGINITRFKIKEMNAPYYIVRGVTNIYGPNLLPFEASTNSFEDNRAQGNAGISAYIQIGYLLR